MFSPDQAKGLSMVFLQSLNNEVPITRSVLAAVPESQLDFKLGDKGRTARELMWHIASSEKWFGEAIVAGNFGADASEGTPPATAAEIVARYDESTAMQAAKIAMLSGEQLAAPVDFFGVFTLPLVLYMDFWIKHTVHHRGQLSMQLRAMNAHVPSIYGGSADEPFQMPATA
ncbi:MAG TPA: DinB family protein [Bryobacteraceae bacterium]|nr:DinB family protein [Bryobacteraceae bacterium]